ncbi:MAG TPA: serine/threonine-protein kinase, partial [Candidatus Saccharimonadales bacterium]|nr:serine/threonine-protein kinase [Candidatus Saccharimonadales bacterium]
MSKSEQVRCPECGSHLPPGLPLGLCPHCALAEFHVGGPRVSAPSEEGAAAPGPGDFGDYEGLREVGRGGMGVVFKAWQKSLERHVAIKMPIFGGFITPDLIKRFRGEAVFAASLHHRNIVPIHEVGIRNGQHYITMDYVDGQNLAARLRARPMSILETVGCLLKVARAVDYAHGQNVLHIDLKPSNILVDAEGEPYVTDFGLAQRIDGNSSITLSGQVVGSPNFMAPEQASPRRGAVDRRSDVYGLGATLYYCLCGRPPFQAAHLETTLNLVLTAEPVSPRVLNPSVPLDLETICLKCLEKEPARRYQTAKDLADEFERFVHHTPIQARPISRWEKVGRWGRRNPALAAASSAAALFLVVGFLVAAWLAGRATREASTARLNLYLADMSLAEQAIQRNNFAYARERLLAHLPEPGWPDLRGWEWRYLWRAVESQHSESWAADKSVRSVAVSPSGAIAADVGRHHGGTVVLDLMRHQIVTNFSAGFGPQSKKSGVFSPDGAVLAMARSNGVLLAHSGRWDTEVLESKRSGTVFSLAFYPDGGTLLATSSAGLKAWKVPSGQEMDPPVNFTQECRNLEISPDGRWLAISTVSDLLVWSLPTGGQVLSRKMGLDQVPAITLSRRGWLAACDRDGRVSVWDLNAVSAAAGTTNLLVQLDTHARGPNYAAAFSPDAGLLAVAGSDQLIRIYNTSDWRERNAFRGHDAEIWSLAFAPNSAQLVSGGKDGLRVWNPQMLPESGVLPGTWFPLRFTPDSKLAVTLTAGRVLQFWRTDTFALESTFKPPA